MKYLTLLMVTLLSFTCLFSANLVPDSPEYNAHKQTLVNQPTNPSEVIPTSLNGDQSKDPPALLIPLDGMPMLAPFWADVDTRMAGAFYYKIMTNPNRVVVIWDAVGYYNQKTDKLNTFSAVFTEGTAYDGEGGNNDGVDWLDDRDLYLSVSGASVLIVLPADPVTLTEGIGMPPNVDLNDPTYLTYTATFNANGLMDVVIPVGAGI